MALFRHAMKDARPLAPSRAEKSAPVRESVTQSTAPPSVPRRGEGDAPGAGVQRQSINPGIDRRTAERLRRGELPIDGRLDLHGLTETAAHRTLDRFIAEALAAEMRVLLIITGKGSVSEGGGVLRRNLPRWIAAGDNAARVLRIEQARPQHGGAGAFYVLLRRRRAR